MRGLQFHAAADAALVADLIKDAGSPITAVKAGQAPVLIHAKVNENRGAFTLKVGAEFLDAMEGKAALFHMSDADYRRLPAGATLLYAGESWLVSAVINNDHRQGICVERVVLCDGGLFPHRCDIWSETVEIVDRKPQPSVFRLVATNQPCWYQFTPNIDEPLSVGRDNDANFFTRDTLHLQYDTPIKNAYWVVNRSHIGGGQVGDRIHQYGAISRVQGAPEYTHPSSLRLIGKASVNVMVDEHPPSVILAAVGERVE